MIWNEIVVANLTVIKICLQCATIGSNRKQCSITEIEILTVAGVIVNHY